jgi:hypothetical protein
MAVATTTRRTWRRRTYIWTLGGLALISALIYWEQIALLFVASMLSMCALLLVVAFSDLEGRDRATQSSASADNRDSGRGSKLPDTSPEV